MSLLTLASVKPHLKIDQSTDDTVLQDKLDAAEAFVSRETNGAGALASSAVSESHDGGAWLVRTLCRPVLAVTSINESYGTYNRTLTEQPLNGSNGFDAYGYTIDKDTGVIERRVSGAAASFAGGRRNIVVVYTTGYATAVALGQDLTDAVRLMTQHFYATQRGGLKGIGGDPGTQTDAYTRAMQILDRIRTSGF